MGEVVYGCFMLLMVPHEPLTSCQKKFTESGCKSVFLCIMEPSQRDGGDNQPEDNIMTKTFNFSANGIDFGDYSANSKEAAQEVFAQDAGYTSWAAMVEQAEEFGGNTVEVRETAEA